MRHAVPVALILAVHFHAAHASEPPSERHALYLDALGRGGLWGLGYDFQINERFSAGSTASFYVLDSQQTLSFSPYAGYYPFLSGEHRWFFQAGAQIVREATLSPVPEWDGTSSTGVGASLASGYEYRSAILVRAYSMLAMGRGRVGPWIGFSIGWVF